MGRPARGRLRPGRGDRQAGAGHHRRGRGDGRARGAVCRPGAQCHRGRPEPGRARGGAAAGRRGGRAADRGAGRGSQPGQRGRTEGGGPCHLPQRAGICRLAVRRDDRDRRRAPPGRHGERAGGERGGRGLAPGPGRAVHRGPAAAGDRRRGRDASALYPARADRAHRGCRAARRRGARAADLQRSCAGRVARRGRGRGRRNRGTALTRGGRRGVPAPAGHSTRAWRSGTSPSSRAGLSSSAEPVAGA
jgi:hypothetical protein